jgi:hypothetical protein
MQSLEQLAPDLWVARRPLRIAVGDIGARMTVVRLSDRTLMLHSPVEFDAPLQVALDELGTVRWIIGPNKAHHLFLGSYVHAFPDALLCGAPGLAEKRRDLRFHHVLSDTPPPGWPADVLFRLIEGSPWMNEVALLHQPTRTLVLTDLVFNVLPGTTNNARLFYWAVGAAGRFGPHRLIRLGMRDRAATRRSIDRILAWNFDRIIMSHGEIVSSGGRAQFERAFDFLR